MNFKIAAPIVLSVLVTGCISPETKQRMSEHMQDSFALTSADTVPKGQQKCIKLNKNYTFTNYSYNYVLPAGTYLGRKQIKSGVYYYSNNSIKATNASFWDMTPYFDGIYLENNANTARLFLHNPQGYADRPIRSVVLPKDIMQHIQKNVQCR